MKCPFILKAAGFNGTLLKLLIIPQDVSGLFSWEPYLQGFQS